jgi:hypothetical protein
VSPELLQWVRDDATRMDLEGVTRADTNRLAAAGLYALFGPPELGGAPADRQRATAESLAGASPDLWFVWFQHGPVVRMLAASEAPVRATLLPDLCSGRLQAGVAFSHLRSGRPTVTAARTSDGWSRDGSQPWCTGWGIADVFLVGAHAPETDEVLLGLVPATRLTSAGELELMTMRGTSTHALRLDGVTLADTDVVVRRSFQEWLAADRIANSNVQPSTFGVADAALDITDPGLAMSLRDHVVALRAEAYALIDETPADVAVERRLDLRAQALLLAMTSATAAVTSQGGRGMGIDDPAQRLLRAAAFQLVHAQAPHVRDATLARLRGS